MLWSEPATQRALFEAHPIMTPHRILDQLGVYVHPGFLTSVECKRLCAAIDLRESHPAVVYSPETPAGVVDEYSRKAIEVSGEDDEFDWLARRFESLRARLAERFDQPLERVGRPRFLIYQEGGYFRPHFDAPALAEGERPHIIHSRKITALLYLNTEADQTAANDTGTGDYEGGRLSLYGLMDYPGAERHGLPVRGEAGLLAAFRSDLLHGVSKLERGRRYCALVWFR